MKREFSRALPGHFFDRHHPDVSPEGAETPAVVSFSEENGMVFPGGGWQHVSVGVKPGIENPTRPGRRFQFAKITAPNGPEVTAVLMAAAFFVTIGLRERIKAPFPGN